VVKRGAASLGNWVPTFQDQTSPPPPKKNQQRGATWRPVVFSPKSTEVAPKTSDQYRSNDFFVCDAAAEKERRPPL